jgi:hypothetical protein
VKDLRWILLLVIFLGAILDSILVAIYMNFAHPWLGILKPEETKEETENLFIAPKVSPGQVGPEVEGVMDQQPSLSPDSVQFKDESVKKPRALQVSSEAFE